MIESLKLENQLCFPLYVCAKEITKKYTPLLAPLGLTYTQYIAMMVLWEYKTIPVGELCTKLYLDTGTLTPMLKKMEKAGLLQRQRSNLDERKVIINITEKGMQLQDKAKEVPVKLSQCVGLETEEALELYKLLNKLIKKL